MRKPWVVLFAVLMAATTVLSWSGITAFENPVPEHQLWDGYEEALKESALQHGFIMSTNSGKVSFISEAPLETISAQSNKLKGLVDTTNATFAFSLEISTFEGFNSPLQREHFNDNYLESGKFKTASFSGKIIEDVSLSKPGVYPVRAKGFLSIHGIRRERILPCSITISDKNLKADCDFTVVLIDHGIKIPRIVYDKISPEIKISVSANLTPQIK
jgi:hypothetical protein